VHVMERRQQDLSVKTVDITEQTNVYTLEKVGKITKNSKKCRFLVIFMYF
jgi:hypothetical protein